MKRIIAIMLMSLFAASCSLGVPIVDDGINRDNTAAGSDNQRDKPDRPSKDGQARGE